MKDPQDFAWMLRQIKQGYEVIRKICPDEILSRGITPKGKPAIYKYTKMSKGYEYWLPINEDIFAEDYERVK